MRSEAVRLPAAAALLMLALPAPAGAGTLLVGWTHLCGSDGSIPLRLPLRRNGDAPTACHGSLIGAEKKKLRCAA